MYRLATLLVLLTLLPAGCGGDDDSGAGDAETAPSVTHAETERRGGGAKPQARPEEAPAPEADAEEEPGESDGPEPLPGEAPSAATDELIEGAARTAVTTFGMEYAGVELADGGRSVTVLVTRDSACNAVAKDEPILASRVRQAVPLVKRVRVEVDGTGKLLGYYVLSCDDLELPDGPGQVVLRKDGIDGPVQTRKFEIKGKRWAVEWVNESHELTVFVGGGRGNYPVTSKKREVGRKVYTSGPGTFLLEMRGQGGWTVRVKDMR